MRTFLFLLMITLVSCTIKQTNNTNLNDNKSSDQKIIKERNDLIHNDTIINSKFFKKNLSDWYYYQVSNNPYFVIDSFEIYKESQFLMKAETYHINDSFTQIYSSILSYSPDSSIIVDLFSNQIELEKLKNGKYGGLYTISVKPFLIVPSKKIRFHLDCYDNPDLFHDNYWLNDTILILLGTTKSLKSDYYSRHYKLWIIDIKNNNFITWINKVSDKNYNVDYFVTKKKLHDYEIWLDDI